MLGALGDNAKSLHSDHATKQGSGGKDGQVPTDIEQATGLERFELLMKLKGEEAFSLEPLEVARMGTVSEPIMVFSLVSLRRNRGRGDKQRRRCSPRYAVLWGGNSVVSITANYESYSQDNERIVGCTGFVSRLTSQYPRGADRDLLFSVVSSPGHTHRRPGHV